MLSLNFSRSSFMQISTIIKTGLGASLLFGALSADAHVKIISHPMRNSVAEIKRGPCGKSADARSTNINTFLSGSTITLEWDEFIFHPGSFRIAFDDDGADFPEPSSYTDFSPQTALGTTLLVTNLLPDHTSGDGPLFSFDVQLPDIECDNCTLQLIQLMTDKPPYSVGGNDIYYNCLDIVLTKDTTIIPPPPAPVDFAGGACAVQNNPASNTPFLLLGFLGLALGLFVVSRKKAK
jgi:LPXTG-motif cell wall-anchored protein